MISSRPGFSGLSLSKCARAPCKPGVSIHGPVFVPSRISRIGPHPHPHSRAHVTNNAQRARDTIRQESRVQLEKQENTSKEEKRKETGGEDNKFSYKFSSGVPATQAFAKHGYGFEKDNDINTDADTDTKDDTKELQVEVQTDTETDLQAVQKETQADGRPDGQAAVQEGDPVRQCPWCKQMCLKDAACNHVVCGVGEDGTFLVGAGCGRSFCFLCEKKLCSRLYCPDTGTKLKGGRMHHDKVCCTQEEGYVKSEYCAGGHNSHCERR